MGAFNQGLHGFKDVFLAALRDAKVNQYRNSEVAGNALAVGESVHPPFVFLDSVLVF